MRKEKEKGNKKKNKYNNSNRKKKIVPEATIKEKPTLLPLLFSKAITRRKVCSSTTKENIIKRVLQKD